MKKIVFSALIYLILILIARYIFLPEKFIYGHDYKYTFVEFIAVMVLIPIIIGIGSFIKTSKKDRSIAITIVFAFFGFLALIASTSIEKARVAYEFSQGAEETKGYVGYTYRRTSSRPTRTYYQFIVCFEANDTMYYSLPGSTDEEIYHKGDSIKVRYLKRDPFLNEIFYNKEYKSE